MDVTFGCRIVVWFELEDIKVGFIKKTTEINFDIQIAGNFSSLVQELG